MAVGIKTINIADFVKSTKYDLHTQTKKNSNVQQGIDGFVNPEIDYLDSGAGNLVSESIGPSTMISSADIQSLTGRLSEEEYGEFVSGVEQYLEKEIAYFNNIKDGPQGFKSLYNSVHAAFNAVENNMYNPNGSEANVNKIFEDISSLTGVEIKSYEQLKALDSELKTRNIQIEEFIEQTANNHQSAKYDYLYFLEDYNNYSFTELSESLFSTLEEDSGVVFGNTENFVSHMNNDSNAYYSYTKYHEKHPEISPVEYVMMLEKKNPNGGYVVYDLGGVEHFYEVQAMVQAYDIIPNFAKTYSYLYEQNPELASDYLNACHYELNSLRGQLQAKEFLDTLNTDDPNFLNIVANEIGITGQGLQDGLTSFVEGNYYSLEALAVSLGLSEENRDTSVSEYRKMYILSALLSDNEKEKSGLIFKDENGNYANTGVSVIDYTKNYGGGFSKRNYEISQGIGNMAPSMFFSTVCPFLGSTSLGISSAGNSYHNAMVGGYSHVQSLLYGAASGTTEAITEKYLGGLPGLGSVEVTSLSTWLCSIAKEGNEEVYQNFIDYIYRGVFLGEELKIPQTKDDLLGFAKEQLDTWVNGALTAGVLNSPGLVGTLQNSTSRPQTVTGNLNVDDFSDLSRDFSVDGDIFNHTSVTDFKSFDVAQQLDVISNENALFLNNYVDLELDSEVKTALDQKIMENMDLISLTYVSSIFGSHHVGKIASYVLSNPEMVSKLSDQDFAMLLTSDSLKTDLVLSELSRRIKSGSLLFDFSPLGYTSYGVEVNNFNLIQRLLPSDLKEQLEANWESKLSILPEKYSNKNISLQSRLALANVIENGNFSEDSQRIFDKLISDTSESYKTFNYSLLSQDILDDFDESFIEEIGVYPDLSSKLVLLHDNNYNLYLAYSEIINNIYSDTGLGNSYVISQEVLNFLFQNQQFLQDMRLGNADLNSLVDYILRYSYMTSHQAKQVSFSPTYLDDLFLMCDQSFEKSYNGYESSNSNFFLSQMKDAYFQKYFSMSLGKAENMVLKYGSHLEEISDNLSDDDGKSLRTVISLMSEVLDSHDGKLLYDLYNNQQFRLSCEEVMSIDEIGRRKYAETYIESFEKTKQLMEDPSKASYVDYNGKKVKVIELTDFSMLVHSNNSGFTMDKNFSDGSYVDSWDSVDQLKSHGLSTTYITQDNFGTAPVNGRGVLYGFVDVSQGNIFSMAPYDLDSHISDYGYETGNSQEFVSAGSMSEHTLRAYNEVVVSRSSKPSCVVIFDDFSSEAVDSAYKAASEWDIPVVRINKGELVATKVSKINSLVDDYKASNDYSHLVDAISLAESFGSGLRANAVEGTGISGLFEFAENSDFNLDYLKSCLDTEVENLSESLNYEKARDLLTSLEEVNGRYQAINSSGTKQIYKTSSLLDLDSYISDLKRMLGEA